jgi:predicted RecB family nuclease
VQQIDGRFIYAASDLTDYLECKRLTELEVLVARGMVARPSAEDPHAELLRRKGDEHERTHLDRLRRLYRGEVAEFERPERGIEAFREAERRTLEAMQAGAPIIYQATFFDDNFIGHADFLRRVATPSTLGGYSYEVVDTKLGLTARPYYLIQLCNYSEHLERLQGSMPEFGHIVFGNGEEQRFRLHDYVAYYRHLKSAFLNFAECAELQQIGRPQEYPFERKHCAVCPWNDACERQRRDDDHLSLVAGMRRDQIAKLEAAGIQRVSELAAKASDGRPMGMSAETFAKLRRQASLQVRSRSSLEPIYELLRHEPPLGLASLPESASGDVFFDMEGDPLFEPGRGLEYLFGCWMPDESPQFRGFWGTDRGAEKLAFEAFVDFISDRRRRHPRMHVYHYAGYEKSALRRLAQLHRTREDEIDELLRGEVLVDLFAVVRQSLAISEERYGLKNLERFYQLARETEVKQGAESIIVFERWLLQRDQKILDDIERYNRDDCRSTYLLREWLLARREEAIAMFGVDLPLRGVKSPDAPCHAEFEPSCAKCVRHRQEMREDLRRSDLEQTLLAGVLPPQSDDEYRMMPPALRAKYLLGNLMAYHRREEKPAWWAYFDRCENVDELFEFDREAIGRLRIRDDVPAGKAGRSTVYTYEFPDQLHRMSAGDDAVNPRTRSHAGKILRIDEDRNLLELKTTAARDAAGAIEELIPKGPPSTTVQRQALARIATSFMTGDLHQEYPATYDLLTSADPRVAGKHILQPERVSAEAVSAVASALDNSYLFVQGPPGSGKSTIGSRVICDLLAMGKRVAVTSSNHKAIHNLLHKVEACVLESGGRVCGRYKHSAPGSEYGSRLDAPFIESVDSNQAFDGEDYQLAGGTAWLYARDELAGKFDYLFIDEAGQVALADALAMSLCAKNVVLLGDPSQLAQVSQGQQPLHAGDSVLAHLLGDAPTVGERRGIFLDVSYRMQPAICGFVSDAMYGNRLRPAAATAVHRVILPDQSLAGLYFSPVDHVGNGSSSVEEAFEIVRQIQRLRAEGMVVDSIPFDGAAPQRPVGDRDIIVVTPYNAQRRLILNQLREAGIDVEVGTVDKFQGQEAAIVFYSMATSSGEDIPRNVEFLFDRNRFNVAISRARATSVLVCSPRLLDIACRTPEQMALANLLCAFAERAEVTPQTQPSYLLVTG